MATGAGFSHHDRSRIIPAPPPGAGPGAGVGRVGDGRRPIAVDATLAGFPAVIVAGGVIRVSEVTDEVTHHTGGEDGTVHRGRIDLLRGGRRFQAVHDQAKELAGPPGRPDCVSRQVEFADPGAIQSEISSA